MTVKELIEKLQREPQDAEILLGLTEVVNKYSESPYDVEQKLIHYETENEDGSVNEYGAEYDGMCTYTSKTEKIIVLRPNVNRIKIVS